MPTIAEYKRDEKVQALVYGRFKMGKTEGAATFPRPNFISFDRGMATVASAEFKQRHPEVDLAQVRFQDFYELHRNKHGFAEKHNAYDDACQYFDAWMEKRPWKSPYDGSTITGDPDLFDTWVIDSGTTLSETASNKAVYLLGDKSFTGAKVLSNTYEAAKKGGLVVPKMQDFGAERSLVEQFIRMVKDAGKHFILICHEKEITNESGATQEIVPLLTGQSVERVCLMFDEVYRYIGKRQGTDYKRVLQTRTDGIAKCGTRLGVPDGTAWDWQSVRAAILR